jgi:enolase-like protein
MPPRLRVRDIAIHERTVRFRKSFRFGAVTVNEAQQAFVHAEIEVEGVGTARGSTAELMAPKWFDKNPALTSDDTVAQLRRALALARELYLAEPRFDTAFGLHAACIGEVIKRAAGENIPPLAAAFGAAEIDKAILDALLGALGLDVFAGLSRNLMGLDARLTPDLNAGAIDAYLAGQKPVERIAIRHTVGLTDAIEGPGGLAAIAAQTGCRYFKLKLGGDPAADRTRLAAIAQVLDALGLDYRATVDANEQYADRASLRALADALEHDPALAALARRLLYVEQPLPREITFTADIGAHAGRFAVIIDEADDSYDAFARARTLGYRGVSSKACKGLYKSLLNGARAAAWNRAGAPAYFVTAEDLSCQSGLAVQQDTALVAFHRIAHAERNGHHYVDGFADTPDAEARLFLAAHPDLYEESGGKVRLKIRDGAIAIGSLATPGFASGMEYSGVACEAKRRLQ